MPEVEAIKKVETRKWCGVVPEWVSGRGLRNGPLWVASDGVKEKLGTYNSKMDTEQKRREEWSVRGSLFKPAVSAWQTRQWEKEKEQKCNLSWKKQERTPTYRGPRNRPYHN